MLLSSLVMFTNVACFSKYRLPAKGRIRRPKCVVAKYDEYIIFTGFSYSDLIMDINCSIYFCFCLVIGSLLPFVTL